VKYVEAAMKRFKALAIVTALGCVGFFVGTAPEFYAATRARTLPDLGGMPDLANGKTVFHAGGC
jgi:hypothetical protein